MKKEIETINKGQEEMNNTISELKNTVEEIKRKRGLHQQAGGQGRKKHPERARKGEKTQKEQRGVNGTVGQHET